MRTIINCLMPVVHVELRFFGGLSVEDTSTALGGPVEIIVRDWRFPKLWLRRGIAKGLGGD